MQFLRSFFGSLLALVVFAMFLYFIFAGLVFVAGQDTVIVEDNSILKIEFNQPLSEQAVENPLEDILPIPTGEARMGLISVVRAIRSASSDPKIKGITIDPGYFMGGYASADEIRRAIKVFQDSGKWVLSYSDNYSETGYYLSSVADEIYLSHDGLVEFNGLNYNVIFFKGLMDKLGIEPEIFKVGDYKSAVEPFIRKDMSPENREQIEALLSSVNTHMLNGIASSRKIDFNDLKMYQDSMKAENGEDAARLKLIDGIKYRDEVLKLLKEKNNDEDPKFISLKDYLKAAQPVRKENKIALLVAEGEIVGGDAPDVIAQDRFASIIRDIKEDESIKSVVLRINSPGGQMQAGEIITRELSLLKEEKPLVVSFSDYAASGGYYIAMPGDYIYSNPATITGSIGVFILFANAEQFLNDKLGITTDEVNTGSYSGILNPARAMTQGEQAILQRMAEKGYNDFINHVADGREMSPDSVRMVASGRVWSGLQAKEIGLIDEVGGLTDALKKAADLAEIDDYAIVEFPPKKDILSLLLETNMNSEEELGIKVFGPSYPIYQKIQHTLTYKGLQTRLPYYITIQ